MKSALMKKTPIAMISQPAILSSRSWCCCSVLPIEVAPSPSRMKITEKLETKSRLGTITRRQSACSKSAAATPVTADR